MINELLTNTRESSVCGPATVVDIRSQDGRAWLQFADLVEGVYEARIAVPYTVRAGDEVLATGDLEDGLFVVGVLGSAANASRQVSASGGAYIEVAGPPSDERLRVYSNRGRLLFEHTPSTGKSQVCVPEGDIEFVAPRGGISFRAARDVRFEGEAVTLFGKRLVALMIRNTVGKIPTALHLSDRHTGVKTHSLDVETKKATIQADESRYSGKTMQANFRRVRWVADQLETVADSVVETAKNVYRTIEELVQVRAGRLRTLISGNYHLKSKKAFLRTEEDFKVQGEKIHLG